MTERTLSARSYRYRVVPVESVLNVNVTSFFLTPKLVQFSGSGMSFTSLAFDLKVAAKKKMRQQSSVHYE